MEWKRLSKREARHLVEDWESEGEQSFWRMVSDLDTHNSGLNPEYRMIRKELLSAWKEIHEYIEEQPELKQRKGYMSDLLFGTKLFEILNRYGMDIRLASFDDIWIYLGMKVVPEITFERYGSCLKFGDEQFKIPADHYYVKSVRIYLKTLWWYLFLSLRETDGHPDLEATQQMLWKQNTDIILNLVERSGKEGYRVDVYREIIRYYCEKTNSNSSVFKRIPNLFRRVMILNTAWSQVREPDLLAGGMKQYVKELFDYFEN